MCKSQTLTNDLGMKSARFGQCLNGLVRSVVETLYPCMSTNDGLD